MNRRELEKLEGRLPHSFTTVASKNAYAVLVSNLVGNLVKQTAQVCQEPTLKLMKSEAELKR